MRHKREDMAIFERARKLEPDLQRKQAALAEVERAAERKKLRYRPSLPELFRIQLQYLLPGFWVTQGIFLLAVFFPVNLLRPEGGGLENYLWWGSLIAAWMGVAVCGEFHRHLARGMGEIEQSCYINFLQMWTIRMILTGGVDILLLGFCCAGIVRKTGALPERVSIYLLVPFVLSNLCCFAVTTMCRGGRGRYWLTVLAVLTGILAILPSVEPVLYEAEHLWMWIILLFFGIVLWLGQLKQCYGKIVRGEIICWN